LMAKVLSRAFCDACNALEGYFGRARPNTGLDKGLDNDF
jgi:hypothetical protein